MTEFVLSVLKQQGRATLAKLFVCDAVEILTMRLSNVDSVCSVSNVAGVGEESALLAPQGMTSKAGGS